MRVQGRCCICAVFVLYFTVFWLCLWYMYGVLGLCLICTCVVFFVFVLGLCGVCDVFVLYMGCFCTLFLLYKLCLCVFLCWPCGGDLQPKGNPALCWMAVTVGHNLGEGQREKTAMADKNSLVFSCPAQL